MPCLRDTSLKEIGLTESNFARSARAITAYLPFDVNFMFMPNNEGFLYIPD